MIFSSASNSHKDQASESNWGLTNEQRKVIGNYGAGASDAQTSLGTKRQLILGITWITWKGLIHWAGQQRKT